MSWATAGIATRSAVDLTTVTTPIAVAYEPSLTHRVGFAIDLSGDAARTRAGQPVQGLRAQRRRRQRRQADRGHRELRRTATCASTEHGGPRRTVEYCVICHNPGDDRPGRRRIGGPRLHGALDPLRRLRGAPSRDQPCGSHGRAVRRLRLPGHRARFRRRHLSAVAAVLRDLPHRGPPRPPRRRRLEGERLGVRLRRLPRRGCRQDRARMWRPAGTATRASTPRSSVMLAFVAATASARAATGDGGVGGGDASRCTTRARRPARSWASRSFTYEILGVTNAAAGQAPNVRSGIEATTDSRCDIEGPGITTAEAHLNLDVAWSTPGTSPSGGRIGDTRAALRTPGFAVTRSHAHQPDLGGAQRWWPSRDGSYTIRLHALAVGTADLTASTADLRW